MEETQKSEPTSRLISKVEPIESSSGQVITNRSKIKELVEPPLVPACEILYDKNIQTLSASANQKNVGENGFISLDFASLSPANQKIVQELTKIADTRDGRAAIIEMPIKEETTFGEIETSTTEIAQKFQKQKMTWAPRHTIEQLREIYGADPNDQEYGPEGFQEEGYYYDPESQLFYLSEEHFQKATEEVKE